MKRATIEGTKAKLEHIYDYRRDYHLNFLCCR